MTFTETVKRVMDLSTAIHKYWDVELRKRHPNYPFIGEEGEDDGPPPPEEAELRDLLQSLPPEELYKLVAVAERGRKPYPMAEFMNRWRKAAGEGLPIAEIISELVGRYYLAADLFDGLNALSAAGVDMNGLRPVSV